MQKNVPCLLFSVQSGILHSRQLIDQPIYLYPDFVIFVKRFCMKKFLLLLLCFSVLAVFGENDPLQNDPRIFKLPKGVSQKDYIPNTLIVKFKKGISASQIRSATSVLKSNSMKLKSASIRDVKQVFKNSVFYQFRN